MTSFKRRILEKAAAKVGYQVLPDYEADDWQERRFVRMLFAHLRPDCVFDVGANVGQYGRELRSVGYKGRILSFEPVPHAFETLEKRASADPLWDVFPFALGSEPGTLSINVMASTVFSSFRAPKDDQTSRFDGGNVVQESVPVQVRTLAEVAPEMAARFGFSRPFLKLDTQGFDLEVVRGAGAAIRTFVGLLSEVAVRTIYEEAPSIAESLDTYRAAGFELTALHPVNPAEWRRLVEFNCYMARADLI